MKTELQEGCTICYEILNYPEQKTITKDILQKLRLLIQTVDFTLLQHKPICEACIAKIKSACKFKTTYLDLQANFIKVKNEEDIYSDKPVFCEICKDIVNSGDTIPLFDPLLKVNKSIIINHLCPELESRINEDPQTCEPCHKSMLNFCNITNLLSGFDQDLICDENESESVTVKKELQQSDIASTSANSSEHCSVKDEMIVKDEVIVKNEVIVKDEVIPVVHDMKIGKDLGKDSFEYDEFIAKNEELDLKMDCKEEPEEEGNWTYCLSTISRDNNVGEFKTKDKHTLKSKEPDETGMLYCNMCEYKSKEKRYLNRHMRIHKEPEERDMFYCNTCKYKSREKRYLNKHMRIHQERDEIKRFQCELCEYQTIHKSSLRRHMILHKQPGDVEMFQCEICEYKTRHKDYLKIHEIIHKQPEEIEMFRCNMCEYKAKAKRYLNLHMHIHKKPEEIEMVHCKLCGYKGTTKSNLNTHMRHKHKKTDEIRNFQCATCNFKTMYGSSIKSHMLRHMKPGERKIYQCEVCEFNTKDKYYLKRHNKLFHMKPQKFQCATCEFKTIHKGSLKMHMLQHN